MIRILTLIIIFLATGSLLPGCSEDGSADPETGMDTSVSAGTGDGASADPLKQLQDEGKLPEYGTGSRGPVLPSGTDVLSGSGPEVTSLYLPSIDPDQDNVPDVAISGHPEIALDNCPGVFNPSQQDSNNNGKGDACE